MFYQGETKYLRDEFLKNPKHWQSYYYEAGRSPYLHGEQLFIEEHLQQDVTFYQKNGWQDMEIVKVKLVLKDIIY